jgi:serine/threonine-protein kinase RsbW
MADLGPDVLLLDLPCDAKYRQVARMALHAACSRADLTIEDIENLDVALGEAFNNVLYHAFDEEQLRAGGARIKITMRIGDREVRVEIEDEGRGFDPKRAGLGAPPDSPPTGNMGLYLMRQMADDLRIESAPGSGTKVSLTKRASR